MLRLAAASLVGTAIEFYDFFVYGTAAALVLGPLFFPTFSPLAGTLAAFATFGVGFVARPLGSVLFGHIGDRRGRRPVLVASLLLTGAATVAVGFVPTYDTLGAAAPALLLVLRFLQGLGLGGEWGGAVLLTAEHAPAERRGLWSSFPQMGPSLGFVLANGVMLVLSAALSDAQFADWGWRVPFWASGVLAAAGLWLRGSLPESPRFLEVRDHSRAPIVEVVRDHWRLVLLTAAWARGRLRGLLRGDDLGARLRSRAAGCEPYRHAGLHHGGRGGEGLPDARGRTARRPLRTAAAVPGGVHGRRAVDVPDDRAAVDRRTPADVPRVPGRAARLHHDVRRDRRVSSGVVRASGALHGSGRGLQPGRGPRGALTPIVATAVAEGERVPWGVAAYLTGVALLSLGCFALLPETRPVPRLAVSAVTE